ncbi:ArsR/SmtB family transcription factor [Paenibacillus pinihumi]|uniref:ArsR/SmtB family transcription factor n=1 Tax=Paenibacillus pinihumi TaxID=669462 RepID=UPI000491DE4B|nr:winged helix-turn-helix domain-containing protein [Paenibacillus pinihumi]
MSYQLEISFRPVNELINSLHAYLCKSWYKRIDLGTSWPAEVQASLSPEVANRLDNTDIDLEWKLLHLLVYISPASNRVDDFLAWLKDLQLGELYAMLSPYMQTFPENMTAVSARLYALLSDWNEAYFRHIDPDILSRLQAETVEKPELQSLSAYEKAACLTNGLYFEPVKGLEKLILVPQYHFQPGNIIYSFGTLTICQYAARIELQTDEDEPTLQLYRLLRSLSEKSRLRILRFLRDEPKSFIEVVRHLGISKGITHDHISNLRSAGLLNAHVAGESISTYSLRLDRIQQVETELLFYLNNGSGISSFED